MKHAVSVVLFRSDPALFRRTMSTLINQSRPPDTVYVLESASQGGWVEHTPSDLWRGRSTTIERVRRPDNLGFAGGHNYLANRAFGEGAQFLTLLNPDMIIAPSALAEYWALVEDMHSIFAVHGAQLLHAPRGSPTEVARTVDSAGVRWTWDGRHVDMMQGESADHLGDRPASVAGVSGALLTISRQTHDTLVDRSGHFLDPLFLAYREDAELGIRIRALGGVCIVHPSRGFVHVRGARNAERTSELQKLLGVQNRFLMRWKLGRLRPSKFWGAQFRDAVVLAIVCIRERRSLDGFVRAYKVRRRMKYSRRRLIGSSGDRVQHSPP